MIKTLSIVFLTLGFGVHAVANAGLVKPVVLCSTDLSQVQNSGWGDPSGNKARYLTVQINEVQYPKSHTMTVYYGHRLPEQPLPPPQNGGWGGGWGSPSYDVKVINHEVTQIVTAGIGRETAFQSPSFTLKINLFKQQGGYPSELIENRTRTRIKTFCNL